MRKAFVQALRELARADERILLLTADLGFAALEPFAEEFRGRFFNVGIAEQNMVGMATGLAEAGFIPFVYSIATFAALRPFEFIRNGPVAHHLPVRVVGIGGGVEYGHNGISHYALEDFGVMRTQPHLTVLAPCDHAQAATMIRATWDLPGPIYYRLSKDDLTTVPGLEGRFDPSGVQTLTEGDDLLLVATGTAAVAAAAAAEKLRAEGCSCGLTLVPRLNPAPADALVAQLRPHKVVITIETHYINGGLGSLVSETVAEHGLGCRVVRCGVRKTPAGVSGSQRYMERLCGVDGESVVAAARQALQEQERRLITANV